MVALTCLARREPVRVLLRFKLRGCCACRARAGHLHGDASAAVGALTLPHSARASEGSVTTQAPWVLCMPGQCRPPAWRCLCCGGCVDAASLGASQSGLCYDSNTWVMCCFRTEPATCTSPPLRRRLRKAAAAQTPTQSASASQLLSRFKRLGAAQGRASGGHLHVDTAACGS